MPGGMQNLLVEVETVYADLILLPFAASANFPWLEHRLRLDNVPRGLQRDILFRIAIEHAEEVVVASGHYRAVLAVPTALELVKDAVVLVQRAQLGAQVFMDLHRIKGDTLI